MVGSIRKTKLGGTSRHLGMKWIDRKNLRIVRVLRYHLVHNLAMTKDTGKGLASVNHTSSSAMGGNEPTYQVCRGHCGLGSSLVPLGRIHHSSSFPSCSCNLFQGSREPGAGNNCLEEKGSLKQTDFYQKAEARGLQV